MSKPPDLYLKYQILGRLDWEDSEVNPSNLLRIKIPSDLNTRNINIVVCEI